MIVQLIVSYSGLILELTVFGKPLWRLCNGGFWTCMISIQRRGEETWVMPRRLESHDDQDPHRIIAVSRLATEMLHGATAEVYKF